MQRKYYKYKKPKGLSPEYISTLTASLEPVVTGLARSFSVVTSERQRREYSCSNPHSLHIYSIFTKKFSMSIIPLFSCIALLALFTTIISSNKCYAVEPSISLSIAESSISNTGVVGEEITISNNITVEGTLINNYNLQISGNSVLEGSTTINSITNDKATLDNNEWGYKWDNTGNYKGISTTPTTIITNTELNTTTGTVSYTKPLTFSAKFSDQAEAGHYKTSVNLLLTATPKTLTTYSITYNTNGGTGTSNPASQSVNSYDSTYTLTAASQGTLTRSGYTFLGWSESSTATSATYTAGSSTITLTSSSPSKTLYAVWQLPFGGITTMQDMNSDICSRALIGDEVILKDDRTYTKGERTYTIRKMEDGKCWMIQGLRIMGKVVLTSQDSDVSDDFTLPSSTAGTSSFESNTAVNLMLSTDLDGVSFGFYSWCAATAGSCGTTSTAPSSICPKNWRLPSSSEFQTLYSFFEYKDFLSYFSYTGYAGSSPTSNGPGRWWTSTTPATTTYANGVDLSGGTFQILRSNRSAGYSVRCVAR